ncbi:MAG: NAD(P)/FAD-dependent oxidoreductase [Bacteroidetes bacterium QS_9_68_14]|nr:MAG: NAD(P)/FAD-dependent oxidoreductase [Bacteroidetes bacterium QS_9_68_14]
MQYDLFVIGTGLAGQDVATACAGEGWTVGIADRRAFGGTCPMRGCDPKKVLVRAAHMLDAAQRLEGHGLTGTGHACIDWQDLMAFKRTFTEPVPGGVEDKLDEAGIDYFHDGARFAGPRTLDVGGERVEAERILIATGAEPAALDVKGEEHFTYSDDFLKLEALPERLVFVGGGYISMEFAHLAARAGATEVTVLETSARVLQHFEAEAVEAVAAATDALGIEIRAERKVTALEEDAGALVVTAETNDGHAERYRADAVVHGAGRVPALGALNLDAAGVERTEDGLLDLDENLRSTSNAAVLAAGDAAQQGPPLTPVAHLDGRAVEKALLEEGEPPRYEGTPTAVFTTPRLAAVGLTEEAAREQGFDLEVESGNAAHFYTARHRRQEHAFYKVIAEQGSGRLLGAHLAYPEAHEVVNIFAQAMRHGLAVNDLKASVYTYPSASSSVQAMLP